MGRYGLIRILACLLEFSIAAQAQQYVFRAYRQADGLKNLSGNALAADHKGYLWLATENGVYRYIGSAFEYFGPEQGIAELNVEAIVVDANDTVWAGTMQHIYRWDGLRFVPVGNRPIHVAFWNSLAVEDAHHLLVVENHRLFRLEHDDQGRMLSYTPVFSASMVAAAPALDQVNSVNILKDFPDGIHVWIGCGNELYSWVDRKSGGPIKLPVTDRTKWNKKNGLAADEWDSVLEDRAGNLWVMGRLHVEMLPRGSIHFIDHSIPGADPGNAHRHGPLIEDQKGRILAPFEDELARWNKNSWSMTGRANGFRLSSNIAEMAFDEAGDLWIATRGNGLYNWVGYDGWEGWNDDQNLPSAQVWTIIPSRDNRVLIGTEKGPAWINPRTGASGPLSALRRWTYGSVDALGYNRDGTLWSGTFSTSVLNIDPRTGKTQQTGKLPAFITRAVSDANRRVFFTTDEGIYATASRRPNAAPLRIAAVDGFLKDSTQVDAGCKAPDSTLWFLTKNRLLRFKDAVWTAPPIDNFPHLSGPLLDLFCAQDGNLWVTGSLAGTWRMTYRDGRLHAWQLVTPPDVRSIATMSIVVDGRGWVWIGTDGGLLAWNGHSWRHLTQESGLIWNDADQGTLMADHDGSLWIGTSDGLSHLLHPERVFDPIPMTVSISGVRRGDQFFRAAEQIALPWSAVPLQIQVLSSITRNRSELIFKYRMQGLQPEWAESRDGLAVFSALPPGNYVFEAMAENSGLGASSAIVQVRVKILSPWWRSNWFLALCGLLIVILFAAVNRLYDRHLRARSKELEEMVYERTMELEMSREKLRIQATHDGLCGMLNRIAILRELAAEMDRAQRESRSVVVALIDLDHFKHVNDAYGHLAGDDALRRFAAAVSDSIRPYDHAGRYGGEEFLLVLTQIPRQVVEQRLSSLHASISSLQVYSRGVRFKIDCSMGAVIFDPANGPLSMESLLAVADHALYAAKAAGRDRVVFHDAHRLDENQETPSMPLSGLS